MHRKKLFRTWVGLASLLLTNQLTAVCWAQQANQPTQQLRPQVRPNSPAITTRAQPVPASISRDARSYGGWTASDPQRLGTSTNIRTLSSSSHVAPTGQDGSLVEPVSRASYYQQFSDLPNLSGLGGSQPPPSLPADSLAGALNDLRPVTPQPNYDAGVDLSYNSTAAFNQDMQGGPPNLGGGAAGFPAGGYGGAAVGGGNIGGGNVGGGNVGGLRGGAAGYDAPRFDAPPIQQQGQVLPNRIPANLATYQNGQNYNGQPSVVPNPNVSGTNLRNANPQSVYPDGQPMVGQPGMNGARAMNGVPNYGVPIDSGLPYVTPAPGQRYLTSPYMGPKNLPIQYTSYQRNVSYQQPVLPQNTQPTMGQPGMTQPVYNPNMPGVYPTSYQCADGTSAYVPPTYTPNWNPSMYSANNNGYRPLFSLGQENYNVQLGRGLYGQPTVYVPGQPIRNFFRYIFP